MNKKIVPICVVLQRLAKEGVYQTTRIGKESFPQFGTWGLHPQCPKGEEPEGIFILSDNSTAIAVCAKHWLHLTFK